jgi:glucokinase
MSRFKKNIIVWDLGATKCAAAWVEFDPDSSSVFHTRHSCYIKLRSCDSLESLILKIEKHLNIEHRDADTICIGAAGIYNGKTLELDNGYPYEMPFMYLAEKYHWGPFEIIHDYAPVVCSTFLSTFTQSPVHKLNDTIIDPYSRRVAVGVGTGLGLKDGVLFPDGNFWLGSNEMGHIGLSQPIAASHKFLEYHQALTQKNHCSFEKILSGHGLLKLHHFLHPESDIQTPEDIGELIKSNKAQETLDLFAFYLGLFIGTVQLSFMPAGGIWITGGVVLKHLEIFDNAAFIEGMESLPAYLSSRQKFALCVLSDHHHDAFMGGACYAVKKLMNLSF